MSPHQNVTYSKHLHKTIYILYSILSMIISSETLEIMEAKSQRPVLHDRASSTSSINGKRKKNYIVTGGAGFL